MVYNRNFVASVKWNGNILREARDGDDSVFLPFGAEYTILLKNLNTVKALVDVEIDGREVITDLIVRPNDTVELERFFEGDMNSGHKFKFIEKSDDIKDFRGDKIEDGIIRITYKFEENQTHWFSPLLGSSHGLPRTNNRWNLTGGYNGCTYSGQAIYNHIGSGPADQPRSINVNSCEASYHSNVNDEGITVEGAESKQSFTYGNIGTLESVEHCINISLKGYFPSQTKVEKPLTVKEKVQCKYCGKKSKSNNKFCGNCGAALI